MTWKVYVLPGVSQSPSKTIWSCEASTTAYSCSVVVTFLIRLALDLCLINSEPVYERIMTRVSTVYLTGVPSASKTATRYPSRGRPPRSTGSAQPIANAPSARFNSNGAPGLLGSLAPTTTSTGAHLAPRSDPILSSEHEVGNSSTSVTCVYKANSEDVMPTCQNPTLRVRHHLHGRQAKPAALAVRSCVEIRYGLNHSLL